MATMATNVLVSTLTPFVGHYHPSTSSLYDTSKTSSHGYTHYTHGVTEATIESEINCVNITFIPDVISSSALRGLEDFSKSYSEIHGYVSTAVCLFGLMSNSANIIVLTRKNMISSTNTILMWLAVADLLTMMSYLPFAIYYYIMKDATLPEPFSTRSFGWIIFLLFHASFSIVCHTVAIWLTIALAIFRYIYICKPTKGSVYCSLQRAKMTICIVYVLTVLICLPNYLTNVYSCVPVDCGAALEHDQVVQAQTNSTPSSNNVVVLNNSNGNIDIVYKSDVWQGYQGAVIISQMNNWIHAILIKLVPCVMLTTLTILLILAMHKAYRKRMRLKSQGRKAESDRHGEHNRTTRMLLAVVVLFTITELPQGILTLMNIFVECFRPRVYNSLGDLLDAMALINNSVNFVLYCAMSKQFRHTFMTVFCSFCSRHRPGWLKLKLITTTNHQGNTQTAVTSLDSSMNNVNHTHV